MPDNTQPISILNPIFTSLVTSLQNEGVNQDTITTFLDNIVDTINDSTTLITEINDLSAKTDFSDLENPIWSIVATTGAAGTALTNPDTRMIQINVDLTNLNTTQGAVNFVSALAYELGHAEDPQLNSQLYTDNSLALGANTAMQMLSEGKSEYNYIQAAQEIVTAGGPVLPLAGVQQAVTDESNNFSDPTQAILIGAGDILNSTVGGDEPPPINESGSGVILDRRLGLSKGERNGAKEVYGRADYWAFTSG